MRRCGPPMAVIVTARLWQRSADAKHLINTMRFGMCLSAVLAMSGFLRGAAPAVGTVNAVEGDVSIDAVRVVVASLASVRPGQSIVTGEGKAELLLTPGVFLRVGRSSVVRLEPSAANRVQISLAKGECMVEAVEILQPGAIVVEEKGSVASIQQPGLYGFNAERGTVTVYDGSAKVNRRGKHVSVKKGESANVRRLRIAANQSDTATPLYTWSS